MSMCLRDAFDAHTTGSISEEDYLQVIAAHCTGLRHGNNRLCNNDTQDGKPYEVYASNILGPLRKFSYATAYWIREYIVGLNREVRSECYRMPEKAYDLHSCDRRWSDPRDSARLVG